MANSTRVAVIVPVYNASPWLPATLDSVLSQTFSMWDAYIVNDGSTDGSEYIAEEYCQRDRRIHLVSQDHKGRSAARNAGIYVASADLIAFLDADDIWLPHKLAKQIKFLDTHHHHGACYVRADGIDEDSRPCAITGLHERVVDLDYVDPALLVAHGTVIYGPGSGLLIRKEALLCAGLFDETMHFAEDLDFCYRLALHYPISLIPEVHLLVRQHFRNRQCNKELQLVGNLQFITNVLRIGDQKHWAIARERERELRWSMLGLYMRRARPISSVRTFHWLMRTAPMWTTRRTGQAARAICK